MYSPYPPAAMAPDAARNVKKPRRFRMGRELDSLSDIGLGSAYVDAVATEEEGPCLLQILSSVNASPYTVHRERQVSVFLCLHGSEMLHQRDNIAPFQVMRSGMLKNSPNRVGVFVAQMYCLHDVRFFLSPTGSS